MLTSVTLLANTTFLASAALAAQGNPPPSFPRPLAATADTTAQIALGRRLFHEPRLSINGTTACATCHQQALAFTDGRPTAVGATGEAHRRNTPTLTNVGLNATLGWADAAVTDLAVQHRKPLFGRAPLEMGLEEPLPAAVQTMFAREPAYAAEFAAAFPSATAVTADHITQAIAAFVRTLLSWRTPFDDLLFRDDRTRMSPAAQRGLSLFASPRLGCATCHAGVNLSGPIRAAGSDTEAPDPAFHNTALYDVDGSGRYPPSDRGLLEQTGNDSDEGRFRAPTLRNAALTAPYMHDGSVATLDAVIDLYAAGGRAPNSPRKAAELRPFTLNAGERADLIAFLHALTDDAFISDPQFGPPAP